jgi:hypothetical protein
VPYKWVRKYAESLERPEVSESYKTIIIDEMWHFVNGKKQNLDPESL